MIKEMKIEEVDHPMAYKLPDEVPKTYIALTWKASYGSSALNIDYAEDTLKRYCLGKEITNLEYFEALKMVKEYRQGLTK